MQQIAITWVNSVDEIDAELFDTCFAGREGRWWYHTLEHCGLADQFTFSYALIHRGSQPVGIAPAFLMDVPMELVAPPEIVKLLKLSPLIGRLFPFLVYQRTLFYGSPCADEGTIGLIPGVTLKEVATALQGALSERARMNKAAMIIWKDFCQDDSRVLENLAKIHGLFRVVSYPGTVVALPGDGVEQYYKNLSRKKRHNLQKKLKKSKDSINLSVEVIQRPSSIILDEVFALFWQTYEKGKTKFERLNRNFFELIAQADVAWFILLRQKETGKLVAFKLCFKLGTRVINKFIGLDYAIAESNYLYFRLWEAALQWAFGNGANEIQSGQTSYSAKLEVGHTLLPLTNYCKNVNPIVHFIDSKIVKSVSWSTLDDDLKIYLKAHPEMDKGA